MFNLAWQSNGVLTLNLREVPDQVLELMQDWTNEQVELENQRIKSAQP